MSGVLGWDIGGVHTKVARITQGTLERVEARSYEIQRDPHGLAPLVARMAEEIGSMPGDVHGITMTAELSQVFRTKREGVHAVLDAMAAAFGGSRLKVYAVDGRFLDLDEARAAPLAVAAANWAATAHFVARTWRDALLVDIGSTTTDIIPIVAHEMKARGATDTERLRAGELVYTGALRTPAEALLPGLAAEGFAIAADVHVWRGALGPEDYSVPTPDGRPATREFAGERLARVVCADREMLDDAELDAIAASLWEAQIGRIADGIALVLDHAPLLKGGTAVVAGVGAFLAFEACRRAGLRPVLLSDGLGRDCRHAPAVAVASLLTATLEPAALRV